MASLPPPMEEDPRPDSPVDRRSGRPGRRLSDEMFFSFFEQAPFYVGFLSLEGKVIEVGRMALEACGYARDEVVGRVFWETPWWRDSAAVRQTLSEAFAAAQKGERFRANLPYLMADGSSRWVDFGMSPVVDAEGRVSFVIATGTDITDGIVAESEIGRLRKRLDSALLAAEIGTYEWDVVSDALYGDRKLAELFGMEYVTGRPWPLATFMGRIHPDDQKRVGEGIAHSVQTGENFEDDYRIVRPEGTRWVNSRGRMVRDASGRVVNFFGSVMDITERKEGEEDRDAMAGRLRRLTAIHETVLSGIADFAYVFDVSGRFLYANRPLLQLYGRPLDDVVGKTFSQLGYPAWHAEMHLREIAQVIATRQPVQGEIPFRGESGISGIYDYIFTPVFGADGNVEAVAGTTRNVTEHKRAEARHRLLVDLDDATRPLTDPQEITLAAARLLGEHLGVNRCAYADVEADEDTFNLTGNFHRDVPSIVGRYRFAHFGEECLRLMRAGEPFVVADSETDPRTAAVRESYRATQIRAVICVPLRKAGRFVAAMAVHQNSPREWRQGDVDTVLMIANRSWESIERTRVIRVLAESEQRLRLAVGTGRLGVWELELPERRLIASNQTKTIHGWSLEREFGFEDLVGTLHEDDRERLTAALDTVAAYGGDFDVEYRATRPDGRSRWVLVRGQASAGADGRPQRIVAVSLDITTRKEAEHEQVRLREEAVRASRAKDDFLATLSHELRTPLNPVLLLASDSAADTSLAPEVRETFEIIRRNVELEARLIDDLLDLTSISRGKLTVRKAAHDLHAILRDALTAVRADFDAKQIGVTVQLEAPRTKAQVDEVRLVQVFSNILRNAAKFTQTGGGVFVRTLPAGADAIAVKVTDTGMGMTGAEIDRVFSAFEQGDHAAHNGAQQFGGLGLGLAIARRLVELHGGTIVAESPGPGKGATFTVVLPLSPEAASLPASTVSTKAKSSGDEQAGTRILLVEDHDATRRTLELLLRRRGYAVVATASLAEARNVAQSAKFELVVSDLGLPDGNGTELMAELRERFRLKGIALTGYGMEEDVARCRAAGFVAHLTKPIRVDALEGALRDALKK